MVEAKHNVQQAELRANMSIAVRVLAQRESESSRISYKQRA